MEQFLSAHPYISLSLFAWTIVWKGAALWKSARRSEKIWFIAMLLINTVGILEIFYIFVASEGRLFPKKQKSPQSEAVEAAPKS